MNREDAIRATNGLRAMIDSGRGDRAIRDGLAALEWALAARSSVGYYITEFDFDGDYPDYWSTIEDNGVFLSEDAVKARVAELCAEWQARTLERMNADRLRRYQGQVATWREHQALYAARLRVRDGGLEPQRSEVLTEMPAMKDTAHGRAYHAPFAYELIELHV